MAVVSKSAKGLGAGRKVSERPHVACLERDRSRGEEEEDSGS